MVGPAVCREACDRLRTVFGMSERRACRIIGADRASMRYRSRRPADTTLRERLRQLAHERRRFGYRRLHVLLRREGHVVNRKRVYRLYKSERLMVRRRGGRKRALGMRAPMTLPAAANERWSLDFVHDQMVDGRRFRILAVVDDCTREMSDAGRRHLDPGAQGCARARSDRCCPRQAQGDRLGQRHGADLQRDAALGR
jgi:putative transposase